MNIRRAFLPALCLFALLTACAPAAPAGSAPGQSPPAQEKTEFSASGSWELVTDHYDPVYYDICKAICLPKYQGKTQEEWEEYSIQMGKVDNDFVTWASDGILSPDGRYLAYHTDKDNLEQGNMSIFLLDMLTGTEQSLLSGLDGGYYGVLGWLDNETFLCIRVDFGSNSDTFLPIEYWLCGPDREPVKLPLDNIDRFGLNGRFLVHLTGEEQNTLNLVRIEKDDTVTDLAQLTVPGIPVNNCAIRADGSLAAFPMWESEDDRDRQLCVWDIQSGQTAQLENPVPVSGTDPAAINCYWEGNDLLVEVNVKDLDNSDNSHFELWKYTFDAQT